MEAKPTMLDEMASALSGLAAIEVEARKLIVVDYEERKDRIRAIQERGINP